MDRHPRSDDRRNSHYDGRHGGESYRPRRRSRSPPRRGSSPPRRENYRSRSQSRRRSGSYSPQRRDGRFQAANRGHSRSPSSTHGEDRQPSQPIESRDIVLLGTPRDIRKSEVERQLKNLPTFYPGLVQEIRLPRDPHNQSVYLSFKNLEDAAEFVTNYPQFDMHDANGRQYNVTARQCEERLNKDWSCPTCNLTVFGHKDQCIKCGTFRSGMTIQQHQQQQELLNLPPNNGEGDVGDDHERVKLLLFRHLAPHVSKEMLANGAKKLLADPDDVPKSKNGIISEAERLQKGARPGSIRRILLIMDKQTRNSQGFGFVEFFKEEDTDMARNRYLKEFRSVTSTKDFTIGSKEVVVDKAHTGIFMYNLPGLFNGFEHEYSVSEYTTGAPVCYKDPRYYFEEYVVSTQDPNPPKEEPRAQAPAPSYPTGEQSFSFKSEMSATKKDKESSSRTKAKSDMERWERSHQEIHGPPSYMDPREPVCYLCSMDLRAIDPAVHEPNSKIHKTLLEDNEVVAEAIRYLEERDLPTSQSIAKDQLDQLMHNEERKASRPQQPRPRIHLSLVKSDSQSPKKDAAAKPSAPVPSIGKGRSMLQGMGWDEGQGLGAAAQGDTAFIAPQRYESGMGLGAVGANLGDAAAGAHEATVSDRDNRSAYSENAKQAFRKRFEEMQNAERSHDNP